MPSVAQHSCVMCMAAVAAVGRGKPLFLLKTIVCLSSQAVFCLFYWEEGGPPPLSPTWNSDWARGTEGSDLQIAKEYNIDPRKINHAKEVASDVLPVERAVTPFSEYKLRLGIAIMIEDAIEPTTVENVKAFVKVGDTQSELHAISTKSAARKWLVSGLKDHRYRSVTKSVTRRQPVGGTPTSKQGLCSGMHLMLSLSTGPWICHISSRVHVWTHSNGNAESPSPRAGGPAGMGCEGSPRGMCADSIGKS